VRPLSGFEDVRGVKGCAQDLCAERCAYHAGIQLWPALACGAGPSDGSSDEPSAPSPDEFPDAGAKDERSTRRVTGGTCTFDVVAASRLELSAALVAVAAALLSVARRMRRDRPRSVSS
jgi:hypothetical protein